MTFGLVLAVVALVLTIVIGFAAALYTPGNSTAIAMKTVYIYTVPYSVYFLLGYYLHNLKKSRIINSTFNIGAVALVGMWVGIILRTSTATLFSPDLNLVVVDNFTSTAVVVAALSGLMLLESHWIH
ncbi:MAG TPA: hypothetical protein ENJ22_02820 [Gammaproteobacteria bacterium]|nr:hypothetical protein [Gammaproteobacteria bacterium]